MGQAQSTGKSSTRRVVRTPVFDHQGYYPSFHHPHDVVYPSVKGYSHPSRPELYRPHDNVVYANGYRHSVADVPGKKKNKKGKRSKGSTRPGNMHSTYGPYPPAPYMVAIDSRDGAPYYYTVGLPIDDPSAYYTPDDTDKCAEEEAGVLETEQVDKDKEINRTSVLISTFADPQQDIIKTEVDVERSVETASDDKINNFDNNNNDNGGDDNNNNDEKPHTTTTIIGGETLVYEDLYIINDEVTSAPSSLLLPGPAENSKYVTYIKDQPTSPVVAPEVSTGAHDVTDNISVEIQEAEVAIPPEEVVVLTFGSPRPVTVEGFIEVGDGDENVSRIFIDEDDDTTTMSTSRMSVELTKGERLFVDRSASDHVVQVGGVEEQSLTMVVREESGVDVVICCDRRGEEIAGRLKDLIETAGVNVHSSACLDGPYHSDVVLDAASAILGAQVTLVLITEETVKQCQLTDLVSLARVANNNIRVVSLGDRDTIMENGQSELLLQLRHAQWTQIPADRYVPDTEVELLACEISSSVRSNSQTDIVDEDYGQVSSWALQHHQVLQQRKASIDKNNINNGVVTSCESRHGPDVEQCLVIESVRGDVNTEEQHTDGVGEGDILTATSYWDQTFPQNTSVQWDKFRYQLRSHYLDQMNAELPRSCMPPLMERLRAELVTLSGEDHREMVSKDKFVDFCTECGQDQDVWERICDVTRDSQAVMAIFDEQSTVRSVAISGVGKHGSPAVVSGLRELLKDSDPVVRCQAVASLSECILPGDNATFSALMVSLDDPDWSVRRAACLAMATIGAPQSVERLRRICRSDPVQHVRYAAATSLGQFHGGFETSPNDNNIPLASAETKMNNKKSNKKSKK